MTSRLQDIIDYIEACYEYQPHPILWQDFIWGDKVIKCSIGIDRVLVEVWDNKRHQALDNLSEYLVSVLMYKD
jgi:hypothetical protein